ncbi:protein FAR1-RELATED SEQUENCE 2-like isoform X2 [Vigna umbellata]|uniref:protein FAR1-RELATED SEQUENCE 2-like isoform X2 n=1 Tax=Vigna umbellata TaxID=87088 RepID=UPI001F5F7503|nr:protein FAR1-RELATED SEQUENCE 2-like isoform X2 [Vigna umbellata]
MEEMYKHCVNTKYSARSTSDPNKLALDAFDVRDKNYGCNRAKPTKKRKSFSKRESSDPERINIKTMDDLRKREQRITRAHNFNNCYIYQQNMQTVDLDSRASTLDAYYGTQQSVLEDVLSGAIAFHCKPWSTLWDAAQDAKTASRRAHFQNANSTRVF